MKTVEIIINADGSSTVGVKGIAGPDCEKLTKAIEDAIGVTTANVRTGEFVQKATTGQAAKQGNG